MLKTKTKLKTKPKQAFAVTPKAKQGMREIFPAPIIQKHRSKTADTAYRTGMPVIPPVKIPPIFPPLLPWNQPGRGGGGRGPRRRKRVESYGIWNVKEDVVLGFEKGPAFTTSRSRKVWGKYDDEKKKNKVGKRKADDLFSF